jgi:hypothetical protein
VWQTPHPPSGVTLETIANGELDAAAAVDTRALDDDLVTGSHLQEFESRLALELPQNDAIHPSHTS